MAKWKVCGALVTLAIYPFIWAGVYADPARDLTDRPLLIFSCGFDPTSRVYAAALELYTQAFDRLGYHFKMRAQPSQRSLAEADHGGADGDCGRSEHLLKHVELANLIQVRTPVIKSRLTFWTLQTPLAGVPTQVLIKRPVKVGYMRGIIAAEQLLSDRPAALNIKFNSLKQGFKMLQAQRIDVLIAHHLLAQQVLAAEPMTPPPIAFGEFITQTGHAYLHRRHQALAEPLATVLAEILADPQHPLNQLSD